MHGEELQLPQCSVTERAEYTRIFCESCTGYIMGDPSPRLLVISEEEEEPSCKEAAEQSNQRLGRDRQWRRRRHNILTILLLGTSVFTKWSPPKNQYLPGVSAHRIPRRGGEHVHPTKPPMKVRHLPACKGNRKDGSGLPPISSGRRGGQRQTCAVPALVASSAAGRTPPCSGHWRGSGSGLARRERWRKAGDPQHPRHSV